MSDCGEKFIHEGKTYYVGYMRHGAYGMWLNEQPNGGFEWKFKDYRPENNSSYTKIFILADDPRE